MIFLQKMGQTARNIVDWDSIVGIPSECCSSSCYLSVVHSMVRPDLQDRIVNGACNGGLGSTEESKEIGRSRYKYECVSTLALKTPVDV